MTQETTTFDLLQANFDKELQAAQTTHNKLSTAVAALNRKVQAPKTVYGFGYCADVSLQFQQPAPLAELLAAYPAEELVFLRGSTVSQKPVSYLRDEDHRESIVPIAPVFYKQSGKDSGELIWWTRLPSGQMAQVQVRDAKGADLDSVVDSSKFDRDGYNYSTGFATIRPRKLNEPVERLSAMQLWFAKWAEFEKAEGYRTTQLSYLKLLRSTIVRDNRDFDWEPLGLPAPQAPMAGTAVAIPPGREMMEYLEELQQAAVNRQPHWLDVYGDFWRMFNQDSAQRFWTFCLARRDEWPAVKRADAEEAAMVASAFERLCAKGMLPDEPGFKPRVDHYLIAETGLRSNWRAYFAKYSDTAQFNVRFVSSPDLADHAIHVSADSSARLRMQDIPVSYVE